MPQLGVELKVRQTKVLRILVRFACPEIWKKKGSRVKRTRKCWEEQEKIEKEEVEDIIH